MLPRTACKRTSRSPALFISRSGRRSGFAHHHHRGPAGYRAARLAPRRAGRQCRRAALRAGCGRHRGVSGEPAEHCATSRREHGVRPIGNQRGGREVRDMSQEEHAPRAGDREPRPDAASAKPASHDDPRIVSRRWLLFKAAIALNGLVGLVLAVPVLRYLLGAMEKRCELQLVGLAWPGRCLSRRRNASRVLQESLREFRGTARPTTSPATCAARAADQFQVFAINCAHLGCPVRWFPQSQLFMCPCHGGVYYADGSRASGPPRARPLHLQLEDGFRRAADRRRPDADALEHRQAGQHLHRRRETAMPGMKRHREARLRLVRAPPAARRAGQGRGSAPGSAQHRKLVVRLRQRRLHAASFCRSSPAFCWRWSMCLRRARRGTASTF